MFIQNCKQLNNNLVLHIEVYEFMIINSVLSNTWNWMGNMEENKWIGREEKEMQALLIFPFVLGRVAVIKRGHVVVG